jgi:hypothetical protein
MQQRDTLTNEGLKGLFKSNFDLANFAIRLARYYVKSGHEIAVDSLLSHVRKNPNEDLDELEREAEEEKEARRNEEHASKK